MDFKSLLSQLDQLNEAEGTTVHKGTYGTSHGKEDVRDQYGHKIGKQDKGAEAKKDAPKKGRGRPKKGADDSGEVKSYDFSAFGVNKGKDVKLPKHDKKKTIKHSLKEYLDQLDKALNEEYTTAPMPGAVQVKDASGKVVATAKSPQAAEMFKKGDVTLGNPDDMKEGYYDLDDEGMQPIDLSTNPPFKQLVNRYTQLFYQGHEGSYDEEESAESDAIEQYVAKRFGQKGSDHLLKAAQANYGGRDDGRGMGGSRGSNLGQPSQPSGDFRTTKAGKMYGQDAKMMKNKVADRLGRHPEPNLPEGDVGKHNNATTGFDAMVRKLTPKYGKEAATRIAGSQMKKIKEADQPPRDALASPLTFEAKDLPGNQDKLDVAEPKGKLDAKDFKELSKKKKVKEGMNTRLKAARHAGKSHALGKQNYNCSYDDMEESRHYHEGFKEGLDECYGQMPIQGYVGEANPPATIPGMASQAMREPAMEDDMYEMDKTAYMKQQAMKTPGDTFKAFGQTFKDKEVVESPFAFEALEQQLNALLESKEDVAEGMTVSISKGQQGAPDSVSVSAQDGEADQLLDIIKSAGLGLFGGDNTNGYGAPQGGQPQHGGLDVVGDHDGMMALIKKVTGGEAGNGDYADEEGHTDEHGHEGACESCGGMMEAGHSCDEGQQMVDEVESEDQMTYQMAEDNPPDSGADNTDAAIADTAQANQAAAEYNPRNDVDEGAGGQEALNPQGIPEGDELVQEGKPSKTYLAMTYLKAVVMAPTGTPKNERIRNWQEKLEDEFDIKMDTATLAQMMPQFDSMLQAGKLDKLRNRMASRGELEIGESEQEVAEVSNDTLTSYLTKVDKDNLKHKMDPTRRSDAKRMKSGPNFVKAFTKLDNRKQGVEEGEEEKSAEEDKADKESMSESMFVNLYKKLTLISEESTSEKDDKAEKAAKKVAKDIEYDEDHKGKDDDKAEEAGKTVKKDIEYDDKKDKKKIDEWANDAGPGKSASDTAFETDIDFMMNVITGGLNKRKSTGQTTIPVLSSQLGRQVSRNTTDINETVGNSSDAVAQWKKLAGLK